MLPTIVSQYEQVPWLMQMRELVSRWWNLEVIYVDKSDIPAFMSGQPSKLKNRVCAICLSSDKGRHLCQVSMAKAQAEVKRLGHGGGLLSYNCHLGLMTMVAPVVIEKRHVGIIYTTGFVDHPLTSTERAEIADAGARINPALGNEEILASLPILAPEQVEQLDDFLRLGARAIVTLYAELAAKEEEIASLKQRLQERHGYAGLVGSSSVMQEVYSLVDRVADQDCTVLVRGASGTGKELVARAVHHQSHRCEGPFVVQNCSAFNDNLLESELFGHVRGAFTGAVSDKKGLFEIAHNGTLFLDEVAEMSGALQAKLLRVLQDHSFWPVGATTPKKSNVRIVGATHRDLESMVEDERFREDLYYRLNVVAIDLPPLKDRRSDIPLLVRHFLKQRDKGGKGGKGLRVTADVMRILTDHEWPGNVRELANEIERMVVLSAGKKELDVDYVSPRVRKAVVASTPTAEPQVPTGSLRGAIEQLEARMIHSALTECSGNRSHAAKMLGIARSNLINKIKSYKISL